MLATKETTGKQKSYISIKMSINSFFFFISQNEEKKEYQRERTTCTEKNKTQYLIWFILQLLSII
jgi:hypothetical protein